MTKMPPVRTVKNNETPSKRKPPHKGPMGKAKVLTPDQFDKAAEIALQTSTYGLRDRLFVYLSRFCAMRAKEIATLHVEDFTDATGKVIPEISISKRGAKYGKERTIDLNPKVFEALKEYKEKSGIQSGPLFWTKLREPVSSNVVQKQLKYVYDKCGFKGARSHSGRRYAITTLAQTANLDGASLEDVKIFAGHSSLVSTASYIEKSPHAKKMVARL